MGLKLHTELDVSIGFIKYQNTVQLYCTILKILLLLHLIFIDNRYICALGN